MAMPLGRVVKLLWPYVTLWLTVAFALCFYSWYEITSSRDREMASGRAEADNLARVLQEQVARTVEGFGRTLGLIKIVYENSGGRTKLGGLTDSLDATSS